MPRDYIKSHKQLDVYRLAFEAAVKIYDLTKRFPKEETYSLTDQIRRSSRSVCSNLAEAWRRRRYEAAFVSKLNESESEAAETQTWIEFAGQADYLEHEVSKSLLDKYEIIMGKLVAMINNPRPWLLVRRDK